MHMHTVRPSQAEEGLGMGNGPLLSPCTFSLSPYLGSFCFQLEDILSTQAVSGSAEL